MLISKFIANANETEQEILAASRNPVNHEQCVHVQENAFSSTMN